MYNFILLKLLFEMVLINIHSFIVIIFLILKIKKKIIII